MQKHRLTISADTAPIAAGQEAVTLGEYASLSEWANRAMIEKAERDARLRNLADALVAYEAEHGVITDTEIIAQQREDHLAAIVVHGHRRAAVPAA
ncbi:MAG: hypothetical protein FWF28_04205 [Micrococcales bacterium]|nr:hypothetical protein [Micrococcales bacterium]